jgi:hypothetical protein
LIGNCGQRLEALTSRPGGGKDVLTYQTGEGDRTGYVPSVSFVRKAAPPLPALEVISGDITSERFWSIRPSGKSTKNWNRTLVGNGQ